jgi:hypothetical protein
LITDFDAAVIEAGQILSLLHFGVSGLPFRVAVLQPESVHAILLPD